MSPSPPCPVGGPTLCRSVPSSLGWYQFGGLLPVIAVPVQVLIKLSHLRRGARV
jgi:hypothetical protein